MGATYYTKESQRRFLQHVSFEMFDTPVVFNQTFQMYNYLLIGKKIKTLSVTY